MGWINIWKCNPLAEGNYIKLTKELDDPKKGLIEIQKFDDNECFKWCLFRCLHCANHHLARIRKIGKLSGDELDFKNIKFPVNLKYIHTIERKNSIDILSNSIENDLIYVPKML